FRLQGDRPAGLLAVLRRVPIPAPPVAAAHPRQHAARRQSADARRRGRLTGATGAASSRRAPGRDREGGVRARRGDPRRDQADREGSGDRRDRQRGTCVSASARNFETLVQTPSPWLSGTGPHAQLVVSTRVRLARNLSDVPFTHRARDEQLQGILMSVSDAAAHSQAFRDGFLLRMSELSALDRQVLVERHLVSHELGDGARPRGVFIGPGERLSLMITEEDHLRLQALASGFQLAEAWRIADGADDELDHTLDFAFNDEVGYMTSCPTNAGTGLRASVLIHLPALVLTQQIQKVLKGLVQVGLNVR